MNKHVFGPVPSRRLGRSLGVDVVPMKTCTYDCIYCQLGRTTLQTLEKREWFPLEEILEELKQKIATRPDYITISGSGEPTLFSRMEELIAGIKELADTPVAVLTNGSLLWDADVRQSLLRADLVMPSLDAGDEERFQYVNRPVPEISFDQMVKGLLEFRREYRGEYWLEVFLLGGVNTALADVRRLARLVRTIDPDRVQLNTVARPPAEAYAYAVPQQKMESLLSAFGERADVVEDERSIHLEGDFSVQRADVIALLRRRPCTIEDIAAGLGLHRNEVVKYVQDLCQAGEARMVIRDKGVYYRGDPLKP